MRAMPLDQYRQISGKKSKYGAVKATVDGIKFDSAKEAARYQVLKTLERTGHIQSLILQPRFDLVINDIKCGFYKADFEYVNNGERIIEDVKGMKTPIYNLKKKLVKAIHNIDIYET